LVTRCSLQQQEISKSALCRCTDSDQTDFGSEPSQRSAFSEICLCPMSTITFLYISKLSRSIHHEILCYLESLKLLASMQAVCKILCYLEHILLGLVLVIRCSSVPPCPFTHHWCSHTSQNMLLLLVLCPSVYASAKAWSSLKSGAASHRKLQLCKSELSQSRYAQHERQSLP